ncbi:MAG: GDP-mannose 4,6-dehydratase [Candidatus Micrarchaeota archaeon]|nr:GDP-mannose 4,6-dehydratase [Candidatus Micrarchaeota archaeon]MDE1834226.1 GDP-mannose 4,6-dehydratase [Candidatus Micrarchaeota archaeon]MDE1859602.1 GDP-mannose 4,6-dehydratase [Candidatus Micrarchaeota archaeon]
MEKILLTGATGFVGKELAIKLLEKKYEVHTLERYVTGRYSFEGDAKIINHHGSLTDYAAIKHIIKDVKPDFVLHLAAISPVSFSYDHYMEVTEANYLGTINLAEACFREVKNFKQFIFAGTSEEYGMSLQTTKDMLKEDSPLLPNSPYAIAKVAADIYLRYMHSAYGFPVTIMRPYNTYGRKDNSHFFIERTITQMLRGNKVYLGDRGTVRDWLYIDDHVNGYIKAIGNKKAVGEVVQLCTGKGYTTEETANIIARLTGFKGDVVWNSTPKRPLDAKILIGDNSKAKRILGWEPKYDLESGLKMTIDYWRK